MVARQTCAVPRRLRRRRAVTRARDGRSIAPACDLGKHRRIVLSASSVVVRCDGDTATEVLLKAADTGPSAVAAGAPAPASDSFLRRSSRRSQRRERRLRQMHAMKHLVIRPSPHAMPLLVFVNPKSGGKQGAQLMQGFQFLLNPVQIFDLTKGGPRPALRMFRALPNFRILVCGGDGTVGWVLSALDDAEIGQGRRGAMPHAPPFGAACTRSHAFTHVRACTEPRPPVALIPLGTGNDLSRALSWGPGYANEPLTGILGEVEVPSGPA